MYFYRYTTNHATMIKWKLLTGSQEFRIPDRRRFNPDRAPEKCSQFGILLWWCDFRDKNPSEICTKTNSISFRCEANAPLDPFPSPLLLAPQLAAGQERLARREAGDSGTTLGYGVINGLFRPFTIKQRQRNVFWWSKVEFREKVRSVYAFWNSNPGSLKAEKMAAGDVNTGEKVASDVKREPCRWQQAPPRDLPKKNARFPPKVKARHFFHLSRFAKGADSISWHFWTISENFYDIRRRT